MNNNNALNFIMQVIKILTPILIAVSIFILTGINTQIDDIDAKLFKHLTNHEIHTPRADVISKGVFDTHCMMANRDREELLRYLDNIKKDLNKIFDSLIK